MQTAFATDYYKRDTPRPPVTEQTNYGSWLVARKRFIVQITRGMLVERTRGINDNAVRNLWIDLIDGKRA